ncbi:hypothetical protein [Streptomyces sp. MUM 2J]|uniref:hypothetical protein n=1 Tax=Streptomyces sp. MUM 2J TaxID=2791987 RepID=UPI001F04ADFC|nr:hypothetical protein [Streptomyces sp. MUM 2J]MCH0567479.1 hypothetical protein [Streptomyces sp. MUM 2J]
MTETKTPKRPARRASDPTTAVLSEVKAARKLVGDRTAPLAGGQRPAKGRAYHLRESNRWRSINHGRELAETPGWDSAVLAEAFGTFAEPEARHARAGLVRLAALAIAAVESIDQESV